ncbi:GNAT family N-acetyltransferase, partial [Acidobacteriota bacterium]
YQTNWGCLNFINTIIKRQGIGRFNRRASLAVVNENNEVSGAVLVTTVSADAGHIPQISVSPEHQGFGLGRGLIQGCLNLLQKQGLKRVSLSVTKENSPAFTLYSQITFRTILEFPAFYWQRVY